MKVWRIYTYDGHEFGTDFRTLASAQSTKRAYAIEFPNERYYIRVIHRCSQCGADMQPTAKTACGTATVPRVYCNGCLASCTWQTATYPENIYCRKSRTKGSPFCREHTQDARDLYGAKL